MGGLLPNYTSFDNLYIQQSSQYNPWQAAEPTEVYNSFAHKYGGTPASVVSYTGSLRNWTWRNQASLLMVVNNP
jgi:hypothetical protein